MLRLPILQPPKISRLHLRESLHKQKWGQVWVQLELEWEGKRDDCSEEALVRHPRGNARKRRLSPAHGAVSTPSYCWKALALWRSWFLVEIKNDSWLVTTWGHADILTMKGPLSLTCHFFFLCFTQGLGKFSNSNELNIIIYHKGLTWLLRLQLGLGNKTISDLPTSLRELCYVHEKDREGWEN